MQDTNGREMSNRIRRKLAKAAAEEAKRLAMENQFRHKKLRLARPKRARVTGTSDRPLIKRERGGFANVKFVLPGGRPTVIYNNHVRRNYL